MAKDPAFLFYPGDYLRDTQTMSEPTQVAYDRIICEHMRNICITQQQLKFFTKRLSEDEIAELMHVLDAVDGGFQIGWVAESISKRKAYSESRRKNREGKQEEHMNNICDTYVPHMENEIEIEDKVVIEDKELPDFEKFWNDYHEITGKPKTDKEPAQKKWKHLNTTERNKAIEAIPDYAKTNEPLYLKKARTYLNDKTFNDEHKAEREQVNKSDIRRDQEKRPDRTKVKYY